MMRAVVAGVLVALTFFAGCAASTTPPSDSGVLPTDHVLAVGNPPVTVIEYADFQCSHCRDFQNNVFPTVQANYINTGKVRWVVRQFPLTFVHPQAQQAAEATECAANQGQFWAYGDLLYANQQALMQADLIKYAAQLGLDVPTFTQCLTSGAEAGTVADDVALGNASGITGTPGFVINGKLYTGGVGLDAFTQALNAALAGQ